jgi:hypothetical protein
MNNLEKWLNLCEAHARQLRASHTTNLKTLKSALHAMTVTNQQASRLYTNLLAAGYTRSGLIAAYNERCQPITGWEAK